MLTMIMSLITSVMLIGVMFAIVSIKNKLDDDEQISVKSAFGDKGLEMLIGCIVLMWIIPYGLIIIQPRTGEFSAKSALTTSSLYHFE